MVVQNNGKSSHYVEHKKELKKNNCILLLFGPKNRIFALWSLNHFFFLSNSYLHPI